MVKRILTALLLFYTVNGQAQSNNADSFTAFGNQYDSLFRSAYDHKDTTRYQQLLTTFTLRYNNLDSTSKKANANRLSVALYNLCCVYSLQNRQTQALIYLDKSIQAGYYNYSNMMADKDLNNIRSLEKFRQLAAPLRRIGDYPYILRQAALYNTADTRPVPRFTYLLKNDSNLVALRKAFNLDSIAGQGNDVSQLLNLMHWLHNLVPHDGQHENPAVKNALSMIAVCKKEDRGLNCRGLATTLNECYLALGFKSRLVTCLPKDSLGIDYDCHVINMVYAPSLKKWLWIDPTFDTYVMNEKGDLLSIEEVRQRIIDNRPLIISPDANWNHKVSETKEHYLFYYMAKNLYRLECPVNSTFNMETTAEGKRIEYIQLLPLDYFKQPVKTSWTSKNTKTAYTYYYTNNPAYFWQVPENN
ncbi:MULTISPECIES: transglutaminase domain-containing protein [Niastella]|uniref:Transglutaminase domain-containing protein n=1 Tax=Niastella soli TaxID=2821487 RepID=A0ABS3YYS5_9BACT|nr:transglutaminase domain-containing protein [Niastella soli]MBO9202570.1 transglutaminase domain-containing protein [Niastella soli]